MLASIRKNAEGFLSMQIQKSYLGKPKCSDMLKSPILLTVEKKMVVLTPWIFEMNDIKNLFRKHWNN
jgi:hypothetical protein